MTANRKYQANQTQKAHVVGPAGPLQLKQCKHLAESETAKNSDISRCLSHRLVSSSASPPGHEVQSSSNGKDAGALSLPAWTGDELAMLKWLDPLLDERLNAALHIRMSEWLVEAQDAERATPYAQAKYLATQGNIEPLREYLAQCHNDPDLKRFINLPELRVGQNWRRARNVGQHLQPPEIAEWAREIRAIWRDHFGKKQRSRDEWTAEEFAFALFIKSVSGKWPDPLREPYPDDPNEKRWVDRATEQNRRRG